MAWHKTEEEFNSETGETEYVWRHTREPRLTVEVRTAINEDFPEREPSGIELDAGGYEPEIFWYTYPAYDGQGIPNSPDIDDSEESALKSAKKFRAQGKDELLAWRDREQSL